MNFIKFFISILIFLLSTGNIFAQPKKREIGSAVSTIKAGDLMFDVSKPISFLLGSSYSDGNKINGFADIKFMGEATFFVSDRVGIGGDLNVTQFNRNPISGNTSKNSEMSIGASFTYVAPVGTINPYIKPSFGVGRNKSSSGSNGSTYTSKDGIFRFGVEAGSLIELGDFSNTLFKPHVGWAYSKSSSKENDNYSRSFSGFFLGAGLVINLGLDELDCDCKNGFENAATRFNSGASFLEYNNELSASRYKYISEYNNPISNETESDEDSQNSFDFEVSYRRAIADRLFVGANVNLYGSAYDYKTTPVSKSNSTGFYFSPVVEYHPFETTKLINAFIESSIGLGSSKNVWEDGTNNSEVKYSNFDFNLLAGYDFGILNGVSLVPKFGLGIDSSKNKETDYKTSNIEFGFSLATRVYFF